MPREDLLRCQKVCGHLNSIASTLSPSALSDAAAPDILVVDDTPANLQLLAGMLKDAGYRVRAVPSGALALRAAANRHPDLILLDIGIPDLNGYDVCRRLKADPNLAHIPVIFISALSEPLDKVTAFESGGVDYVTKPFQTNEVAARVKTHLELKRLREVAEARAGQLELVNQALRESERLRENLVQMLVHDLRGPLSGLLASLQLLELENGQSLDEEGRESLRHAFQSVGSLTGMITDLLDVTRLEAGRLELDRRQTTARQLTERALDLLGEAKRGYRISLAVPGSLQLQVDPELICRVLVNLIGNALKFTTTEGRVDISASALDRDRVRFCVSDQGPGIAAEYHGLIFEKFGQVEARRSGSVHSAGLGLAFCKLAVEAHGGVIGVESEPGQGSTFWFELAGSPQ